ncbi:GntR family transcriptional regulator [Acidaminococcus massiliensis]|jgi:DNA-binding GntR family transcriptional regulator|uniref:GntR family transcriptional regulator n=1 Tax=Acidaminococcus massiliensis TaxID=1852375 RepID=UPI0023F48FD5|nr:GntR family transcriptional regulator [Acidaminococcus massiliensis]
MMKNTKEYVDKSPLSEKVYQKLINKIVTGEIAPESRLREEHIANEYNVSATPVREAFKRLASDGFIEIIPYHGAIVRGIDEKEIEDVYHCRLALENLALEEAIPRLTQNDIKEFETLVKKTESLSDMFGVADTNKKFHELIYEAANNKTLTRLIESLNMVLLRDMKFSASDESRKREIINEHKVIITALKYKNIEEAKKAMRRHILNGKEYIEKRKG